MYSHIYLISHRNPYTQNNMYKLFEYIRFWGRVAHSKCTPNIANTILHNETNIIARLFMRITSNAPPPKKNQILMKLCVYTIQLRNEHTLHTFHTYIHASHQILFFFRNICSVWTCFFLFMIPYNIMMSSFTKSSSVNLLLSSITTKTMLKLVQQLKT